MATNNVEVQGAFAEPMLTREQQGTFASTSPVAPHSTAAERPTCYLERLIVRSSGRVVFVRSNEIEWCQACENYVQLHSGSQGHLLRGTMTQLETQLDPNRFVRISRSAIINLDFVREIRSVPAKGRVVRLIGGTQLTVGREYRARLRRVLENESY